MPRQARIRRNDRHDIDGRNRIQTLIECLGRDDVIWTVDQPADPNGLWWIDLTSGGFSTNVAWQPERGFGVYTSDEEAFGAGPDETYREPERAAKRLRQLMTRPESDKAPMRLAELRQLVDRPQTVVARQLSRDQGFVSKLERQNDAKLSTIRAYVEALGGEVRLMVRFDGFEAPVVLPIEPHRSTGVGRKAVAQEETLMSRKEFPNAAYSKAELLGGETVAKEEFFIERRDDGKYKVLKPDADRASAVADTQKEAIERAKELNPEATRHIERVRNVGPGRDKWRHQ